MATSGADEKQVVRDEFAHWYLKLSHVLLLR